MLPKLMLPETLIVTLIILPILIHILQQLIASLRLQNLGDILIFPRRVAVLLVRSVAVIGPTLISTILYSIHAYACIAGEKGGGYQSP